jgi:hypothetical protein
VAKARKRTKTRLDPREARAIELAKLLQDFVLGKRKLTAQEAEEAMREFNKLVPDLEPEPIRTH